MADVPISLWIWGGIWLLLLIVALVAESRDGAEQDEAGESGPKPAAPPVGPEAAASQPLSTSERFQRGLERSRGGLGARLRNVFASEASDPELLADLEDALIAGDVGVGPAGRLVEAVRAGAEAGAGRAEWEAGLRSEARRLLGDPVPEPDDLGAHPWVQLVIGVNGVGKTTTIGKLAARHAARGRKVLLVAGDTFRAAAGDQLAVWAERAGAEIVRQAPGADPSAVVFDGLEAGRARGVDVVLIDTAGRLHTKVNLMEELAKVRRVIAKVDPQAPHEALLVLDATTGQNALAQARAFGEVVPITGVILTKLDGSARGGMALAIREELGAPIRYVGLGESAEDLQPFEPDAFLAGLLPSAPRA